MTKTPKSQKSRWSSIVTVLFFAFFMGAPGAALAQTRKEAQAQKGAQNVPLDEINHALATLQPQSGRFTQSAANGDVVQGRYFMDWPQRLRFAYDNDGPVITVRKKFIAIQDTPRQEPNWVPVSLTPLALIRRAVAQGISPAMLVEAERSTGAVHGANSNAGYWALTLRDPEADIGGQATLYFTAADLTLYAWRLVDAQQLVTQVALNRITRHKALDSEVFDISYDDDEDED